MTVAALVSNAAIAPTITAILVTAAFMPEPYADSVGGATYAVQRTTQLGTAEVL
jgi:hypothetical protein